jgi:hypothetical protein
MGKSKSFKNHCQIAYNRDSLENKKRAPVGSPTLGGELVAGALSLAELAAITFMKRKQKPDKLIGIEFKGPRGDKR